MATTLKRFFQLVILGAVIFTVIISISQCDTPPNGVSNDVYKSAKEAIELYDKFKSDTSLYGYHGSSSLEFSEDLASAYTTWDETEISEKHYLDKEIKEKTKELLDCLGTVIYTDKGWIDLSMAERDLREDLNK